MKKCKVAMSLALLAVLLIVPNAFGQLGTTDNSSFIVQNLGTSTATVSITFYDESGASSTPSPLNAGKSNPFSLAAGESFEVYVPGIPGLADGRYSVVISSNVEGVVAIANLIGDESGTTFYNGSYSGVSAGSTTVYLPAVVHEYYNWNSLISVQNAGSAATDIQVQYKSGSSTYTHTATNVPAGAAVHFDLETSPPSGMPSGFSGSAIVTATGSNPQPLVVTDNQTADGGFTQSYNGFSSGATTFYAPALYDGYYGWVASLNIQNVGSASTSVTVDYTDSVADEVYPLDAGASVPIYLPAQPAHDALFAATITSSGGVPIVAIVSAAHPTLNQAQTSSALAGGTDKVGLPTVMKGYYDWDTSFTVQNVDSASTVVTVCYSGGYACYDLPSLAAGASTEVYQPAETFLPSGYRGSVTLTSSGEKIGAIVNEANPVQQAAGTGDWSMSYNGFNQ